MGSNHEKNVGRKPRDTLPFSSFATFVHFREDIQMQSSKFAILALGNILF